MANCVISAIEDTDRGVTVPACVVHAHYAPCPRDGEPACQTPVHTDERPSRDEAVEFWRRRTHGQRRLVLHRRSFADGDHDTTDDGGNCWCGPEVMPS